MQALERIAPKRFAFPTDRVGLQVGDPEAEVRRAVVAMDRSLGAVGFAAGSNAQMLVTHHPLIYEPLSAVLQTSHVGRTILELARHGIAFAAAHTNWDSARGGINDALACMFGLSDVRDFGTAAGVRRLKVAVFSPGDYADRLIDALGEAGAGVIGDYTRCAFSSGGEGTFLGGPGSKPAVGQAGRVEKADEIRIEMVLPEERMQAVAEAIRLVHPYEEPAFDFFQLAPRAEQPAGRIGDLPESTKLSSFVEAVDAKLETASWAWGDPERPIRRLAIVGGAADGEWRAAQEAGADALLTGEVKQHVGLEAVEEGFAVVAAGHYATENPGSVALRDRLEAELPEVEWLFYAPEPGLAGRPWIR